MRERESDVCLVLLFSPLTRLASFFDRRINQPKQLRDGIRLDLLGGRGEGHDSIYNTRYKSLRLE